MWNVGVILEKENTDPQTYMNTHVPMRVFTLITRELKITFFCNFPSPFTYKIKKEMSWASNSVDCGSRFQCSSSRWVSGREVEMTQVWPKLWCNCLRLAVSQGLKNVIILPHHPTLDKVPHAELWKGMVVFMLKSEVAVQLPGEFPLGELIWSYLCPPIWADLSSKAFFFFF